MTTNHISPSLRPIARYAAVAQVLLSDIQNGKYAIGEGLPTEAVLQERFGVSRHTVREALRELRNMGVIASQQGIGTQVRASADARRFVSVSPSIGELLNFAQETRMTVLASKEVIADATLSREIGCSNGQAWRVVQVLRHAGDISLPIGYVEVYLRPEHAGVESSIAQSGQPIFTLIERQYGVRLAEIQQQISSVLLQQHAREALACDPSELTGLRISRRYLDDQERLVQVSLGVYPGTRFSFQSNIRVQRTAT